MTNFALNPRVSLSTIVLAGLVLSFSPLATQADDSPEIPKPKQKPEKKTGTIIQPWNDRPQTLKPKEKPSVLDNQKHEAQILFVAGYSYALQGKREKAYDYFRRALKLNSNHVSALSEMSLLCFRMGKFTEGHDYCERALKLDPTNGALITESALFAARKGDINDATKMLEKAVKLPAIRKNQSARLIEIRQMLVIFHNRQREYVKTAEDLEDLIDISDHPHTYNLSRDSVRDLQRRRVNMFDQWAQALRKANKLDEALVVLKKGRLEKNGSRLSAALAEILLGKGQAKQAAKELEDYFKLQLQVGEKPYILYQQALKRMGKADQLPVKLEELLKSDKYNKDLRLFYARHLIENKKYDDAEKHLDQAKGHPSTHLVSMELHRLKAQAGPLLLLLAKSLKDPALEVPSGDELAKIAKDGPLIEKMAEAARKVDDKSLEFFSNYIVARLSKLADKPKIAEEFFHKCIKRQPTIASLRFELIEVLWNEKKYDEVVKQSDAAIEKLPNDLDFYEYRARGLTMLKKYDEAKKGLLDFLKKQKKEKTMVQGLLLVVWVDQRAGQFDQAIAQCEKILKDYPDSDQAAYTRYVLSGVYMQAEDQEKSEAQLQKILAMDKDALTPSLKAAAENDLGYLWAERGVNLDKAEVLIRSALKVKPENAAYLDSLGWVLFQRKKFDEAVKALQKAVDSPGSDDGVLHEHLGDAYLKIGNKEKALSCWKKAMEFYKQTPEDTRNQQRAKKLDGKLKELES